MRRLDVSVVGELNLDLILYGVPEVLDSERELLVNGMAYPRLEIKNMVKAVKSLPFGAGFLEKVFRTNAERLLGGTTPPTR